MSDFWQRSVFLEERLTSPRPKDPGYPRFFGPAVSPCAASKRRNCEARGRVRWPHIQIYWRRCAKRERCHARHASFGEQARRRRHFSGLPAPTPNSLDAFGAQRPYWREVVMSSSCASERVRRSLAVATANRCCSGDAPCHAWSSCRCKARARV